MLGPLNVGGSEWVIIIFVALVLILGTGKLPSTAKKLGKLVNEYNKTKEQIQNQIKDSAEKTKISGPVKTQREKLDNIAESIGINHKDCTDEDLQKKISDAMNKEKSETL